MPGAIMTAITAAIWLVAYVVNIYMSKLEPDNGWYQWYAMAIAVSFSFFACLMCLI